MSTEMTEEEKAKLRGDFFGEDEDGNDLEEEVTEEDAEEEVLGDEEEDDLDEEGDDLEVEEDPEGEEEEPAKIPRSRLNKEADKRRKAEERSQYLEEQLLKLMDKVSDRPTKEVAPEVDPFDFDEAEEKYLNLVLEGEVKEATKLRREINKQSKLELQALVAEAREDAVKQSDSSRQEEKFGILVSTFEDKYPFLDSSSDDYDEEMVDDVNALMSGYIARGDTKAKALEKAVNRIAPTVTKTTSKLGKDPARERASRKKAAATLKSQPSKTKGTGTRDRDLSSLDVSSITSTQWKKLTPKEKAILRGDIIE